MGKDYQDWGGYQSDAQTYVLKDLAELAARLDSPVKLDRGGSVIVLESFEYGLQNWIKSYSGAASDPVLSADYSLTRGFSCQLQPGLTASDRSGILTWLATPPGNRFGLSVRLASAHKPQVWIQDLIVYEDNQFWGYTLRYVGSSDTLTVYDGSAYQSIGTIDKVDWVASLWHHVKLVIDQSQQSYVRVIFDNHVFDISDVSVTPTATSAQDRLNPHLWAYSDGASAQPVYVDDVIVTYNEP